MGIGGGERFKYKGFKNMQFDPKMASLLLYKHRGPIMQEINRKGLAICDSHERQVGLLF